MRAVILTVIEIHTASTAKRFPNREDGEASIQRQMEKARQPDEEEKKQVFSFVPPVGDFRWHTSMIDTVSTYLSLI
jgi:hypothetical protein